MYDWSKRIILLFLLTLWVLTTPSLAQQVEVEPLTEQVEPELKPEPEIKNIHFGKIFIDLCESPNESARRSCGEVVISLLNAHVEMTRKDPSQRTICPARTLTAEEGRRAFLRWANLSLEARTIDFQELVMNALRILYQCDKDLYDKV
ncbi:MAG: hypothetical protein K0U54_02400 [Bacteroidetes bacterium]|nr:hypothetical protein [Bacteroidota bacterium]